MASTGGGWKKRFERYCSPAGKRALPRDLLRPPRRYGFLSVAASAWAGFWEGETEYLEELIGVSFIVLQTKIRRVASRAVSFNRRLKKSFKLNIAGFENQSTVRALGNTYKCTGSTVVQLIWDIGNYFKHRDEWPAAVWDDNPITTDDTHLKREIENGRSTRKSVAMAGIERTGNANLRTAYEFLGVVPYSNCECLVERVQGWADLVYAHSEAGLPVDPDLLRRARARRYARYFQSRNSGISE